MHPRYLQLLSALSNAGVSYAIGGGYALALHGAVRGTVDLDLVLGLSRENYLAAESVLLGIDLHPRLPVDGKMVYDFRTEYIEERNLVAWSFFDPQDPTCLVDLIITHEERYPSAVPIRIGELTVPVLSVDALIEMKRRAGRPQDLADISALERIRDLA